MMDQKYFNEIKMRIEIGHETDSHTYRDIPALLAEVERLTARADQSALNYQQKCRDIAELEMENATLKSLSESQLQTINALGKGLATLDRALKLACNDLASAYVSQITEENTSYYAQRFIQQAQEEKS